MIEVVWAYAIGAGFAMASAHQLQERHRNPGISANRYLLGSVLYVALLVAPAGAYLLAAYPSWSSFHLLDSAPWWLVGFFYLATVIGAALGFGITQFCVVREWRRWAALQLVGGYFVMTFILAYGWDGRGYQRFLSLSRAEFDGWSSDDFFSNLGTWLTSNLAITLYLLGAILLPIMGVMLAYWHITGIRSAEDPLYSRSGITQIAVFAVVAGIAVLGGGVAGGVAASVVIGLLGWLLGGLVVTAVILVLFLPRRGLVGQLVDQVILPQESGEDGGAEAAPAGPQVAT
ncbi:hypothetical protein GCM10012275_36430 [Longimycelium tulufanense]|uniref:Uncharacterized protein n=1 Tax=Longimycelium tulufanense TaxID=907463 RepID=A0A8J3FXG7_9PSEU|nr:hypothetical protein [Longimycelium tulufanense]GGM62423.1 hypothetical protein GCM10012275_36430 [Longimycelium tulufanense]